MSEQSQYIDLELADAIESVPTVAHGRQSRRDWSKWILIVVVIVLVGWQLRGCVPTPGPDPIPIPVDSPAVLFALNGDEGITIDQAQVAISQIVQRYADENEIDYRRYDVSNDLRNEAESWQKMMEAARQNPPAMVTVDRHGVGVIKAIPSSVDEAIEILKALK